MCDTNSSISAYAILIGINAYQEKPLEGSVRDVQRMQKHLEKISTSIQIEILTATRSQDPEARTPIEPQHLWPTHQNVISALTRVVSSAKPGDIVYIHYSGHGTRTGPYHSYSNSSAGDLALVLLDERNKGREKYLHGAVLAYHLKQMVDKGLVVTLVLDCCFSATVYRADDSRTRYLPYNPEPLLEAMTLTETLPEEKTVSSEYRDACMLPNWLIDPDGYAILAACGPHEMAKEIDPGTGQMQGALSYFLLSFLEISGLGTRHDIIHKYLGSKFREMRVHEQSPVLYGNRNQTFFHQSKFEDSGPVIPMIMGRDARLLLSVGDAHGVRMGDCFGVRRVNLAENSHREQSVSVRVVQVGGLTSRIEPLEGTLTLQPGWFATGFPRAYLQKYPVRLASDLLGLHGLLAVLEAQSISCHTDEEQPYSLYLAMNNNKRYEIYDRSGVDLQRIEHLPDMVQGETDLGSISDTLKHLMRYRFARELSNGVSSESFQESFDAHIISPSGEMYGPEHLIETDEGVKHQLVMTNKGKTALYVYVYNLGFNWQIVNISRGCEVVPPPNPDLGFRELKRRIATEVPKELKGKGIRECEDMIKVLITSQPTSFDLLELPKLNNVESVRRSTNRATTIRSSGYGHTGASENWAALNFPIRTFAIK
ncbi:caspase domain-containing protein [Aspergillus arachidicola]|uniref:Caspase domain-containing protein n=1 Tax=Aspergillus arachidicola TaxID=656916 RepID=A0A5N6XVA9_9EURO|nr:caspase domain-containing protein [Aspergillus arachidicola]